MRRLFCLICLAAGLLRAQPGCVSSEDKQRLDAASRGPRVGTLAAEFQQKLAARPDDPEALYLYARSLMGKDTKQAIGLLTRAAEVAPSMPWTHEALAEIYASRNFLDNDRALAHLHAFHRLCPDAIEAYHLNLALTSFSPAG